MNTDKIKGRAGSPSRLGGEHCGKKYGLLEARETRMLPIVPKRVPALIANPLCSSCPLVHPWLKDSFHCMDSG